MLAAAIELPSSEVELVPSAVELLSPPSEAAASSSPTNWKVTFSTGPVHRRHTGDARDDRLSNDAMEQAGTASQSASHSSLDTPWCV